MVDGRTREGRAQREQESRAQESRNPVWQPGSLLPEPTPREGITHRWIRTAIRSEQDVKNVSSRFREGWVPCKKTDYPELANVLTDYNSKFPENIEIGGLLLCYIDSKIAEARQRASEEKARQQVRGADQNFMREQDPRMPLLKTQRTSHTTFGGGQAPR